jgi:hypothetical protein
MWGSGLAGRLVPVPPLLSILISPMRWASVFAIIRSDSCGWGLIRDETLGRARPLLCLRRIRLGFLHFVAFTVVFEPTGIATLFLARLDVLP